MALGKFLAPARSCCTATLGARSRYYCGSVGLGGGCRCFLALHVPPDDVKEGDEPAQRREEDALQDLPPVVDGAHARVQLFQQPAVQPRADAEVSLRGVAEDVLRHHSGGKDAARLGQALCDVRLGEHFFNKHKAVREEQTDDDVISYS